MTTGVKDVASDLEALVLETVPRLEGITEADSNLTRGAGTWSRKQVLGHLIDSALNNVHRFIRVQQVEELSFPDYDQPFWVDRAGYQERPWSILITLWAGLNDQVAAVIRRIPADRLRTPCRIGAAKPLPLEFIVRDYQKHLQHHLEQILAPESSTGKSHPPFAREE
jgi:hypothetical protein